MYSTIGVTYRPEKQIFIFFQGTSQFLHHLLEIKVASTMISASGWKYSMKMIELQDNNIESSL